MSVPVIFLKKTGLLPGSNLSARATIGARVARVRRRTVFIFHPCLSSLEKLIADSTTYRKHGKLIAEEFHNGNLTICNSELRLKSEQRTQRVSEFSTPFLLTPSQELDTYNEN